MEHAPGDQTTSSHGRVLSQKATRRGLGGTSGRSSSSHDTGGLSTGIENSGGISGAFADHLRPKLLSRYEVLFLLYAQQDRTLTGTLDLNDVAVFLKSGLTLHPDDTPKVLSNIPIRQNGDGGGDRIEFCAILEWFYKEALAGSELLERLDEVAVAVDPSVEQKQHEGENAVLMLQPGYHVEQGDDSFGEGVGATEDLANLASVRASRLTCEELRTSVVGYRALLRSVRGLAAARKLQDLGRGAGETVVVPSLAGMSEFVSPSDFDSLLSLITDELRPGPERFLFRIFFSLDADRTNGLKPTQQKILFHEIDSRATDRELELYLAEVNCPRAMPFLDLLDWWHQALGCSQSLLNRKAVFKRMVAERQNEERFSAKAGLDWMLGLFSVANPPPRAAAVSERGGQHCSADVDDDAPVDDIVGEDVDSRGKKVQSVQNDHPGFSTRSVHVAEEVDLTRAFAVYRELYLDLRNFKLDRSVVELESSIVRVLRREK